MSELRPRVGSRRSRWLLATLVFGIVTSAQLWLVAAAGTDIPYQDQWDAEGSSLYPLWQDGTLEIGDVLRPHNEHRIIWTKLLDLALFTINGQWDPLVQLAVGALLRGAIATVLVVGLLAEGVGRAASVVGICVVSLTFLPHLGWFNALWGFQSQVYFSVFFSVLALLWLGTGVVTQPRLMAGFFSGVAAQLAMSAGAFVPVAVLGVVGLRFLERRAWKQADLAVAIPCLLLLALAVALRVDVPAHATLQTRSAVDWLTVFLRIAAWPHDSQPLAAFALNAPVVLLVANRVWRASRTDGPGEDFALLLAGWALAGAAAVAWFRSGGGEFYHGVPSRYVDFFVLLPIANTWAAFLLVRQVAGKSRTLARACAGGWIAFLFIGWLGLSAQTIRGLILPRVRDREAPVRLAVAFQHSHDPQVFTGQWRVIVPHPSPSSVSQVLNDPRMVGVLPPSLQPDRPMGPLSRVVRWVLRRPRHGGRDGGLKVGS